MPHLSPLPRKLTFGLHCGLEVVVITGTVPTRFGGSIDVFGGRLRSLGIKASARVTDRTTAMVCFPGPVTSEHERFKKMWRRTRGEEPSADHFLTIDAFERLIQSRQRRS